MPAAGVIYRLTEQGRLKIATFDGGAVELDITLDPCNVRIYEIDGH